MASHYVVNYDSYEMYEDEIVNKSQNNGKKSKRRRYFPSNTPQTLIINAVTGVPYPYVVGSKEQSMLYRIIDTTGTCDEDGYVIKSRSDLPNSNPNHLFYDSPEQCMSHLNLIINPVEVKEWHEKHKSEELPVPQ